MLQVCRHSHGHLLIVRPVTYRTVGILYPLWNDILVVLDRFVWRYPGQSVHDSITETLYTC
jgi:hypothetical protein